MARWRIGGTCPETHACRPVHTNIDAKLAPNPGGIGLCYPDVPDLIMSRILGFLLLIVLLALSFGWHPLATVKEVMRQRGSYQVRQNGFNWVEQRKRHIEDAERPRLANPESVSPVVPSPMSGIDGAVPIAVPVPTPVARERAGVMNDELFQSSIPTNTPATPPGSKQQ